MRVKVLPVDREGGSGAYRMRWPAQALAAQGCDVEVVYRQPGEDPLAMDFDGQALYVRDFDADVVVFQRCAHLRMPEIIRRLQDRGIACVVEVDDDFSTIDPRHVAYKRYHPRSSPLYNFHHIAAAARIADMVVVTTPALARRYGGHGRVAVIPNYVPERYLTLAPGKLTPGRVTIGWSGTVPSHPGDLDVTRGAVAQVVRDTGAGCYAFGWGTGVKAGLGLDAEPGSPQRVLTLDEYIEEVARLDIGIAPLAPTAFNDGKSGLKDEEYAACEVAAVVSPTPDNRRLARLGIGVLAARPREWRRELTRLVTDPGWRAEVAGRGREAMRGQTIEGHAEEWWAAWAEARVNRQRRRGRAA